MNQFYRMFPDAVNTKQAVSQLEAEAIVHQVDAQLAKTEITQKFTFALEDSKDMIMLEITGPVIRP